MSIFGGGAVSLGRLGSVDDVDGGSCFIAVAVVVVTDAPAAFCVAVVEGIVVVVLVVVFFVALGRFGLVANMVENAGNKADSMSGNSTVWTISIPSRSSLAAARASSKSVPSNRLLTGSQFIRLLPLVLVLSSEEKACGDPGKAPMEGAEGSPVDIVICGTTPLFLRIFSLLNFCCFISCNLI